MQYAPLFSIIIPARNEENALPRCLDAIKHSAGQSGDTYEVIVVINRCTDRTQEIAQAAGCRLVQSEAKNLSIIRNAGAAQAIGSYLITIDADSTMHAQMLPQIKRLLANPDIIGGGVLMLPERFSVGIVLTVFLLLPVAIWYGITAGLFFTRRADFEAIGGFDEKLVSVEDIDFARRLKAYGKSRGQRFATIWRSWIVTSCRKFDQLGDWYFILNPRFTIELFRGKNQAAANKIWYDFEGR